LPNSSTAAQMAMGDALAVCLLECRGFTKKILRATIPEGIGKKLYLKISDLYPLIHVLKLIPVILLKE
jgi:arabinose-5-phosphate isomerase